MASRGGVYLSCVEYLLYLFCDHGLYLFCDHFLYLFRDQNTYFSTAVCTFFGTTVPLLQPQAGIGLERPICRLCDEKNLLKSVQQYLVLVILMTITMLKVTLILNSSITIL